MQMKGCCLQYKGIKIQANHNQNNAPCLLPQGCCLQYKGIKIQANHNESKYDKIVGSVVAYSTKVLKFKQITTRETSFSLHNPLLLIVQRY